MKGCNKISRGSGFRGVCDYLQHRSKAERRAGATEGRRIGGSVDGDSPKEWAHQFSISRQIRPDIQKPVWHSPLRCTDADQISDERWNQIAQDYLQEMGFDLEKTQWLAVRHDDENACHILTSRIQLDGSVFLGQNENLKSTKIISKLEQKYGLTPSKPAPDHPFPPSRKGLKKGEIDKAVRTAEAPARTRLQSAIDAAIRESHDFDGMASRLKAAGIETKVSEHDGRVGLSFGIDGTGYRASKLGADYSFSRINERLKNEQTQHHSTASHPGSRSRNHIGQDEESGGETGSSSSANQTPQAEVTAMGREADGRLEEAMESDRHHYPNARSDAGAGKALSKTAKQNSNALARKLVNTIIQAQGEAVASLLKPRHKVRPPLREKPDWETARRLVEDYRIMLKEGAERDEFAEEARLLEHRHEDIVNAVAVTEKIRHLEAEKLLKLKKPDAPKPQPPQSPQAAEAGEAQSSPDGDEAPPDDGSGGESSDNPLDSFFPTF